MIDVGLGWRGASRDPWGSEATLGFEGLCVFASWMARTAHDKPFHPPVLFSSFIWVRGAGDGGSCTVVVISRVSSGAGILFSKPAQGCHFSLLSRSLSPFPPSCLHLGVVARVGWGGASFFPSSLCASQRERHLPRGWGNDSSSSLALPKALGTGKVTEGKGGG